MRIAVVGAGPAGLLFSSLVKQHNPRHEVVLFEQKDWGATRGFGVGLTERCLMEVRSLDADLADMIETHAVRIDNITLHYKGECATSETRPFWSIGRGTLLRFLQSRAHAAGVDIQVGRRIDEPKDLSRFDLVVGADGIGSGIRKRYEAHFDPCTTVCANRMIWCGVELFHPDIRLIFRHVDGGLFIGHVYPFSKAWSTFVVECDPAAWHNSSLASMTDEEGRRYCEGIFSDILEKKRLVLEHSRWFQPKFTMMRNWSHENTVLIGDAVKSLHPSIGAGTQAAFEDAAALLRALDAHWQDLPKALDGYERVRKPSAERQQQSARASVRWYEALSHTDFTDVGTMTRSFMARTHVSSLH